MGAEQEFIVIPRQDIVGEMADSHVLQLIVLRRQKLIYALSHSEPHTVFTNQHVRQHDGGIYRFRHIGHEVEAVLNLVIMIDAS